MLRGEKVILRAPRRDDIQRRWEFANDLEFGLLISDDPWEPVPLERLEAQFEERLREPDDGAVRFAIEADGRYIGHCLLYSFDHLAHSCMIGIGIGDPAYRGGGYGRDALRVLLDYAFRIRNLHRVWLSVTADNERAIRAYRACGFVEEGRLRQHAWTENKYVDMVYMGLLRDEWATLRQ